MRYVTIPAPAVVDNILNKDTRQPITIPFATYIRDILVMDPKITADDASLGKFMEMASSVKSLPAGAVWELSTEQHEFLGGLARGFQYSSDVKLALLPHIRAITSAPAERPLAVKPAVLEAPESEALSAHES